MTEKHTIAVAMSGGVDSSTVAAILARLDEGTKVVGLTLQLWDQTRLAGKHGIPDAPKAGRCCSLDDVYDARRVAEHLGIPYYVVNQEERFERTWCGRLWIEYLAGRTPIPCSLCNNHLKFDQLLKTARSALARSRIATGHYAVNEYDPAARAVDSEAAGRPGQGPDVFSVRADAGAACAHAVSAGAHDQAGGARGCAAAWTGAGREAGLAGDLLHSRRRLTSSFLTAYLEEQGEPMPETAGELVASNGEVIGRHEGISNFTVGQRKGLKVCVAFAALRVEYRSGEPPRDGGRGCGTGHATRCARERLNWISIPELTAPMRVRAKIRHRHEPAWATLEPVRSDSTRHREVLATFDEPQRAVTPGQSAVFYDGDEVVGGGWII